MLWFTLLFYRFFGKISILNLMTSIHKFPWIKPVSKIYLHFTLFQRLCTIEMKNSSENGWKDLIPCPGRELKTFFNLWTFLKGTIKLWWIQFPHILVGELWTKACVQWIKCEHCGWKTEIMELWEDVIDFSTASNIIIMYRFFKKQVSIWTKTSFVHLIHHDRHDTQCH